MEEFRFKSSRYQILAEKLNKWDSQIYAGNLMELCNKKCSEICALDIPERDKDIAWEIRNEEISYIGKWLKYQLQKSEQDAYDKLGLIIIEE